MKEVATRGFNGPIEVTFSEDELRVIMSDADHFHQEKNTNPNDMTLDQKLLNTRRGYVVEKALASVLEGSQHSLQRIVELNQPSTYDHDVVWRGRRIEVKSVDPQYRHWKYFSYSKESANTMIKSIKHDSVQLIVAGYCLSGSKGKYVAAIDWVINPKYYAKSCVEAAHDGVTYLRFGGDPRLKTLPFSLWKGNYEGGYDETLYPRVYECADGMYRPAGQKGPGLPESQVYSQAG